MTWVGRLFGRNASMVHDDEFRLLLAANAIGALGTALVSPLLNSLTGPFGVSGAEIGLLVTAVGAPSIFLIPISGVIADRIGRKPVLITGLILFGSAGAAIALTTDFTVVLALRALQGVGFAGVTPIIITSFGDLYADDTEATAQGIRFGVTGLSQAVFPAIAGIVVVAAWQYPFLIYALALPIAALVWLFFDEPADDGRDPDNEAAAETGYGRGLARLAAHPHAAAYLVARAIVAMPFFAFLTYNSLVIGRIQGGSASQAGLLVAAFSIVYAVTSTQAGRITAWFDHDAIPLVGANVLLGGGLATFALTSAVPLAIPSVVAMGVGVGITFSLYRSIITGVAPPRFRGGLVSLSESGARAVATLTPVTIGGLLAVLEPSLGRANALRWILVGAGVVAVLVGVASVLLAHATTAPEGATAYSAD